MVRQPGTVICPLECPSLSSKMDNPGTDGEPVCLHRYMRNNPSALHAAAEDTLWGLIHLSPSLFLVSPSTSGCRSDETVGQEGLPVGTQSKHSGDSLAGSGCLDLNWAMFDHLCLCHLFVPNSLCVPNHPSTPRGGSVFLGFHHLDGRTPLGISLWTSG